MDLDLGTICLLGILFIVGAMVLPRLMNSMGGSNYSQRGSERPRYRDPDVQTGGGFGGEDQSAPRGEERPRFDDPDVRTGGGFGGSGSGGFRLPFGTRGGSGQSSGRSRGGTSGGTMGSSRDRGGGRTMGGSKSGGTASSSRQGNVGRRNNRDNDDVKTGGGFGGSGS